MIALPALYFGLWFIGAFKKRGLDVYTYILLLYFIISIFSILLDSKNLYSEDCLHLDLGVFAPILYCVLLTFCITPFKALNIEKKCKNFQVNERFLDGITYFYFAIFLIIFFASFTRINEIIATNAFDMVRREQYSGDAPTYYGHLSGVFRYVAGGAGMFATSGYIMILVFFYNITFRNKSIVFNLVTLLGSCSQLLCSVSQADRSQFFYWMVLCGLAFVLFRKKFTHQTWRYIYIILGSVAAVFLSYLLAVTIARFSYREADTSGGIINYLGQSYINFCNFINYLRPDSHSLCEIFPFTNEFIFKGKNYFQFCEVIEKETGMIVYGFSTFMGFIFSISGGIVLFFYILFYRILTTNWVINLSSSGINSYIRIWCLSIVLVLGIFTSFYSFSNTTIALILWLYIAKKSQKRYDKNIINRPTT